MSGSVERKGFFAGLTERVRNVTDKAPTYAQHLRDFLDRGKEAIAGVLLTQVGLTTGMTMLRLGAPYEIALFVSLSIALPGVLLMVDGSFRATAGHGQGVIGYFRSPRSRQ